MPLLRSPWHVKGMQGGLSCRDLCSNSLYVVMNMTLFMFNQVAHFPSSIHSKYTASASEDVFSHVAVIPGRDS